MDSQKAGKKGGKLYLGKKSVRKIVGKRGIQAVIEREREGVEYGD